MRLVRHYDQAERETVGAVHRKSMGPKLRKALRKVGGQKFSGSDCLHHIYKATKLGSSVARIQRRLVVHSCFSRTHWWDGDRASVDGSCHHSMEMERISVHRGCSYDVASIFKSGLDEGLRLWQTRSHAVVVCSVPADCIYKVISQKGSL